MSAFGVFNSVILIAAAIIIAFDIYLFTHGKTTISEEVVIASKRMPIYAFGWGILIGVLAGHFWFQFNVTCP